MELVEEISVILRESSKCGATTPEGEFVFCDDARLNFRCECSCRTEAQAVLARLSSLGLVIVPREPTKEMVLAGDDAKDDCVDSGFDSDADGNRYDYTHIRSDISSQIYRAMIDACEKLPVAIFSARRSAALMLLNF